MIIFTNGNFDILHTGHFNLLMYCRELAGPEGKVIVALDDDEKITIDKGLDRPVFDVHERAKAVLDLTGLHGNLVNTVEFFNSNDELEKLIKRIQPDIIVKGSDWMGNVVGSKYARVVYYERLTEYSSSEIIRRCRK